ncbi:HNH endonuclease [Iamia majanohamensis]|uniref:HNH endonuclease n=1 Tax=Iamia majanohamensis TaxID=467976 RepID=UPI003AF220F8
MSEPGAAVTARALVNPGERIDMAERICRTCSGPLPPRKPGHPRLYCSNLCQWRRPRGQAVCKRCGETFTRTKRNQRLCSRTCTTPPPPTVIPWASCLACRTWFVARHGRTQHAYQCRQLLLTGRPTPSTLTCGQCGRGFHYSGTGRPRRYCSNACARQAAPAKRAKRTAKALRRARQRSAPCEPIDPHDVFKRDNWTCGLCGGRTQPTAEVPHPDAPTLDHVVPLAQGGHHTLANVQCAHFRCNTLKGDSTMPQGEQLRLIG